MKKYSPYSNELKYNLYSKTVWPNITYIYQWSGGHFNVKKDAVLP